MINAVKGLSLTGGDDTIHGGEGSDLLFGEVASANGAILSGGDDLLFGGAGEDDVFGQTGDDHLDGGAGTDDLNGGAGRDIAAYGSALAGVTADLLRADLNTRDAKGDSYTLIEGLLGSKLNDSLRGNDGANSVSGGDGNDLVFGRGGDDVLFGDLFLSAGEAGNDRLDGGAGADKLNGGVGTDAASYATATAGVRADLLNAGQNTGDAKGDTYASIENLIGSRVADRLGGNGFGNALAGGAGNDLLTGGAGLGTFVFAAGSHIDRILDFENGLDRLDLSGFDFGSFAEVKALGSDTAGGDLRLDFGGGDVLVIDEFSRADLTAEDVLL